MIWPQDGVTVVTHGRTNRVTEPWTDAAAATAAVVTLFSKKLEIDGHGGWVHFEVYPRFAGNERLEKLFEMINWSLVKKCCNDFLSSLQ